MSMGAGGLGVARGVARSWCDEGGREANCTAVGGVMWGVCRSAALLGCFSCSLAAAALHMLPGD